MSEIIQYYPLLFHYAHFLTGNTHDAEDLVQETFVKVFHALSSLKDPTKCRSWIISILLNTFRTQIEKRNSTCIEYVGSVEWAYKETEQRECPEKIASFISLVVELPENLRKMIELHYLEQHSYSEIALILDISVTTVKARIYRARKRLLKNWRLLQNKK